MSRYTVKSYKVEITDLNKKSASNYHLRFPIYAGRYEWTYADEIAIDTDGKMQEYGCIDNGSPRDAMNAAYRFTSNQDAPKKISRAQAKVLAVLNGIDFSKDFFEQQLSDASVLNDLAKLSGYKKPRNANGSLARYFFQHLLKKVFLDIDARHINFLIYK